MTTDTTSYSLGLAMAAALAACGGGEPIPDDLASRLTETTGCADVALYAYDTDDQLLLSVVFPDLIDQARAQGGQASFSFTLPDPEVTVQVEQGEELSGIVCNDVALPGRSVDATYRAISGTAEVTITPMGDDPQPFDNPASASATLEDVVLENDDGDRVELESFQFPAIDVGWLPG